MRDCELCGQIARIYCESDEARLCWDCDEKVHGANFLVAKHLRSLLCHVCQSSTPWKASGRRLTPTVSVCVNCVEYHGDKCDSLVEGNDEVREEEDDDNHEADMFDSDDDEIEEDEDFDEDDDDGENQVVPWSCSTPSPSFPPPPPPPLPLPPAVSYSSSEEDEFLTSKRMRENADLDSDEESGFSLAIKDEATSFLRPLKRSRSTDEKYDPTPGESSSRPMEIIRSLRRIQNDVITDVDDASKTVLGIRKLCTDQN